MNTKDLTNLFLFQKTTKSKTVLVYFNDKKPPVRYHISKLTELKDNPNIECIVDEDRRQIILDNRKGE